jgi:hypothetical protein
MKFTVEQARCAQGYALLQAELFREYNYTETPGQKDTFQIPFSSTLIFISLHSTLFQLLYERKHQNLDKSLVSVLLDCLNIYGIGSPNFPALQIAYKGYGHPLLLMYQHLFVCLCCTISIY